MGTPSVLNAQTKSGTPFPLTTVVMTTNSGTSSAAHVSAEDIDNIDAFARRLFKRARGSGSEFADIADVVRSLHTVLKHLKSEAEDPESLLNSGESPVYVRQLKPILEDCDFTLKQLETLLQKYGDHGSGSDEDGFEVIGQRELGDRERYIIGSTRTKLANQRSDIDIFLDTVQLHNPLKSRQAIDTSNANLDSIKDRVDAIAARIMERQDPSSSEDDDELWLRFRDELEKEGFSRDVLRKNQDVLRAYIRQLDEQSIAFEGSIPTVRGFLAAYSHHERPQSIDHRELSGDHSPKEMYPSFENEKYSPSMKTERLQPDKHDKYPSYPPGLPTQSTGVSHEPQSSEDGSVGDINADNSMALVISTRDLMTIDRRQADLATSMNNLHLQPPVPFYGQNYTHAPSPSSSPQARYLPSSTTAGLLEASSPTYSAVDEFGLSPRSIPPVPPPPYGTSPPPTLHYNSVSAPTLPAGSPQRYCRLAPDSQGRDIPLDAKWTRIKRSLVSTQVLNQRGLRYEARPEFVAVLGTFTKDQIADLARASSDIRRLRGERSKPEARDEKGRYHPNKYKNWDVEAQTRRTTGRRRDASPYSSSSELYDSSDTESDDEPPQRHRRHSSHGSDDKGTKVYPFIVSPPDKDKENGTSPAATVKPKPILKNKDDDPHVRIDPKPQVFDESTPRSLPRHSEKSVRDAERRHRDRDRYDDRDRDRHGHHRHYHRTERERREDEYRNRRRRDDNRDRHRRDEDSEDRSSRRKARGETLRAVGIGGAAASLLSVLTEAASQF